MDKSETLAVEMAEVVKRLAHLCWDLIQELAQYREIDREEQRMREIVGDAGDGDDPWDSVAK